MKNWRSPLAGIVGIVMLAAPALAPADSLDATSTARFLAAEMRLGSKVIAVHEKVEASAEALVDHVESACPGAVPSSLQTGSMAQQRTWTALVDGAAGELAVAEQRPLLPALRREHARVAALRWTSAALNGQVAAYVSGERLALSLHPPDLCQQARSAARSGFTVIPAGIKAFNARFESTEAGASALALARQMKPLATPAELVAIKRLRHQQSRIDRLLGSFVSQVFARLTQALTGASVPGG
jgi:hypothetical protein